MGIMSVWSIPIFKKTTFYFPENLDFVVFWLLNSCFSIFPVINWHCVCYDQPVKEEKVALYQTSLPGNQHRGKNSRKTYKHVCWATKADTGYTTGEIKNCMENRNLWRAIIGVHQMTFEWEWVSEWVINLKFKHVKWKRSVTSQKT